MNIQSNLGHIVWHDLLTHEVGKAQQFYAELLGWVYQVEHASNFAWKAGEADYPLIIANGEAHGGIVESEPNTLPHWIAYVMVKDVVAVTSKAKSLGAAIIRAPFNVPGVGHSAVIQDRQGALICPYVATHNFPPPHGTFVWNELITDDVESAKSFYTELFGWKTSTVEIGIGSSNRFKCADNTDVAGVINRQFNASREAVWVTYLTTHDVTTTVTKAKTLGARVHIEERSNANRIAILSDPMGALFGLLALSP